MLTLKRGMALCLALVLVAGMLPLSARAADTHQYVYTQKEENGVLTHSAVCSVADCQDHKPVSETACEAQGEYFQTETQKHYQKCVCGREMSPSDHTYTTPEKDGENHWNECVCGAKSGVTPHTYTGWTPVASDSGTHKGTCSCGAASTQEHSHAADAEGTEKSSATCAVKAVVEYTCQTCNAAYTVSEGELAAHTPNGEGTLTTPSTCTAAGERTLTCSVCKETYTVSEPATGHNVEEWEYDAETGKHTATCGNAACPNTDKLVTEDCTFEDGLDGSQHWQECTVCGGKKEVANHSLTWMANAEGKHWQECDGCGYKTAVADHTLQQRGGTAATCKTDGTEVYQYCSVCQKNFQNNAEVSAEAVKIPKSNEFHELEAVAAKEATCKAEGNVAYVRCKTCGKNYATEADAKVGTELTTVKTEKTACKATDLVLSFTTPAEHHYTCKVCGDAAEGSKTHTFGEDGVCTVCAYKHVHTVEYHASTATCAAAGEKAYYSCTSSLCPLAGKRFDDNGLKTEQTDSVAPILTGHTLTEVAEIPATCKSDGVQAHKYCPTCKLYFTTSNALIGSSADGLKINKTAAHTVLDDTKYAYDHTGHWNLCSVCGTQVNKAAHSEGLDGKCDKCGYDPSHTCSLKKVAGKAPTCTEAGKKVTYVCSVCSKVYEDAAGKTVCTDTTLPAKGHSFAKKNYAYNETEHWFLCDNCGVEKSTEEAHNVNGVGLCGCGYNEKAYLLSEPAGPVNPKDGAVFVSSANREDLISVSVDGVILIPGTQYLVRSGSTIVTLTPGYLETLEGKVAHTLAIRSKTGTVVSSFTIAAKQWQDISYAKRGVSKTYGVLPFTNPLTETVVAGKITYTSSNTKVATVDANGRVTLKGIGTCTITATAAETADYAADSASYTLRVYEPGDNPKTGDAMNAAPGLLLTASAALLAVLFFLSGKGRKTRA